MSAHGVAIAAGIHVIEAQDLLQKHRETYVKFWAWADQNKETTYLLDLAPVRYTKNLHFG